jgi:hypothetical protein
MTPWPATVAAMTLVVAVLADRMPPGLLGGAALVALCLGAQGTDGLATALWIGAGLALCGSATSFLRLLPALRGRG